MCIHAQNCASKAQTSFYAVLQECNHFADFFGPRLAAVGYSGAFLAKSSSPANDYGCATDGSALFYRTDRLSPASCPRGAIGTCSTALCKLLD